MEYDLIDIQNIEYTDEYIDMVDIEVEDDHTFILDNNIISHNSACGSILQKRDPTTDSVYTLRGKVKNVRTIEDLSSNKEIIDLMNILDLNLDDKGKKITFDKIIIATDADPDGYHIAGLIINFFNKWFPHVIKMGKLFILNMPLISVGINKRKYYYSIEEFHKESSAMKNVRYLKGLGSNDLQDWGFIFNNLNLVKITYDKYQDKMLTIAFGNNSNLRKLWLQR